MTTETKNDKLNIFLKRMMSAIIPTDKETKKKIYSEKQPHPNLHNFHTIKWLRKRFDPSVFKRSINTLLPNNGIPEEDGENGPPSRLDLAKKYLETYCQPDDKFK